MVSRMSWSFSKRSFCLFRVNKNSFLLGSNVNEAIRAILNFFFFKKRFYMHKKHKMHISKDTIFMSIKTSKGKKVAYSLICVLCFLCFLCFLCNFSWKQKIKIKTFQIALMTSFTLLLTYLTTGTRIGNLFVSERKSLTTKARALRFWFTFSLNEKITDDPRNEVGYIC